MPKLEAQKNRQKREIVHTRRILETEAARTAVRKTERADNMTTRGSEKSGWRKKKDRRIGGGYILEPGVRTQECMQRMERAR